MLTGVKRREYQAEIVLKYCGGNPRKGGRVFGWKRETIKKGLGEKRSGISCQGAQSQASGNPLENSQSEMVDLLRMIAENTKK